MEKIKSNRNTWHKTMYDRLFAEETIASKSRKQKSKSEASFLIKTLDLPKAATVLDVPCGSGRHAIHFAKKGYQVTGVDINRTCLKLAKKNNPHKNIRFVLGDLKNLRKYKNRFDAVLNLFTSFGYFSTDSENENVLRQLVSALKPGGKLAIITINRDYLLAHFNPAKWDQRGEYLVVQSVQYNPKTKYIEGYYIFIAHGTHKASAYYHRIRLYSPQEMKGLMKKAGLENIRIFGSASSHPCYIGEKE